MSNGKSIFRSIFSMKVILPLLALVIGGAVAVAIVKSSPKAKKRRPAIIKPTVEVMTMQQDSHQIWVPVMGTVSAARQITLKARVSGDVATLSPRFAPGGLFKKGDRILTISPEDYELALSEVRSQVADAEYNLKVEQGYQNVSAREYALLKESGKVGEGDADLVLRKPHLEKAKAGLASAKAKLKQAQLDLSRTRIRAPFAAMVEDKNVDIGASISTSDSLATLIGTEEFWIKASVPVDRLDWINIPMDGKSEGGVVRIKNGMHEREGRVIRLLPSLESEGRMARLLISVKDPLNLAGKPGIRPLLLGSYVSIHIDGGSLGNVYAVPRSAVHDNNKVWILTPKGTLEIRAVAPIWRDASIVLVDKGFEPGDRLITSSISAPLSGMALQSVEEAERAADSPKGPGAGKGKGMNKEQTNG